jgi:hypothetical protein
MLQCPRRAKLKLDLLACCLRWPSWLHGHCTYGEPRFTRCVSQARCHYRLTPVTSTQVDVAAMCGTFRPPDVAKYFRSIVMVIYCRSKLHRTPADWPSCFKPSMTPATLGGEARDPLYADHSRCTSFVVLPDWHWMATWCSERAEFKMWYAGPKDSHVTICSMAKDAMTFSEATCSPTFTFVSLFTVHVDRRDRTLVVYELRQMAPRWRSPALTA